MSNAENQAATGVPFTFEVKLGDLYLASEAPETDLVVRKSDDSSGMDELEASIKHLGVIYPLITKNIKGKEYVVAGNRRLKVLRKLYGEKHGNKMITVVHATEFCDGQTDMREVAMAVNIALPPHAVDRYEVLAAQIKAGLSRDEVAARNALAPSQVTRILALAALAPEIRDAWRHGTIDSEVAKAFTLAPDQDEQVKFFNKMKKNGHMSAWQIQERFIGAKDRDVGRFVEFVGIENYEKAGGHVRADLFGMHHAVSDHGLLQKMFGAKMEETCKAIIDQGWSFATPVTELGSDRYAYGTLEPAKITMTKAEREKLAALHDRVEASDDDSDAAVDLEDLEAEIRIRSFTPENKARSGCFVEVNRDGTLKIEYGRTKPPERSKAAAPNAKAKDKAKGKGKPLDVQPSSVVLFKLDQQLHKATAAALVKTETKGLPALLARIVAMQIKWERPVSIPMEVSAVLPTIRSNIPPKILKAALLDAFDRKEYFNAIPKDLIVSIISKSIGATHATKARTMSKEHMAKFAIGNLPKDWLPHELVVEKKSAVKRK